jgi:hypothetical protein
LSRNKIIWKVEHPARADKSAMGAVNRPLQAVWVRPDAPIYRPANDVMHFFIRIIGAGRDYYFSSGEGAAPTDVLLQPLAFRLNRLFEMDCPQGMPI